MWTIQATANGLYKSAQRQHSSQQTHTPKETKSVILYNSLNSEFKPKGYKIMILYRWALACLPWRWRCATPCAKTSLFVGKAGAILTPLRFEARFARTGASADYRKRHNFVFFNSFQKNYLTGTRTTAIISIARGVAIPPFNNEVDTQATTSCACP